MLGNNVLLKLDEQEEMTKSGLIHIPDTGKDMPQTATVIAVGPGRWNERRGSRDPMFVCEGDRVIFPKYSGSTIEIDGKSYISVKESDLTARLAPDELLQTSSQSSE